MEQLQQILFGCDARVIATDARSRLGWVETWKETIRDLQSANWSGRSTDRSTLELIRNVSNNQHLVAEQMLEMKEDFEREIDKLHRFLDTLDLDDHDSSSMLKEVEQYQNTGNQARNHHPSPPPAEEADNHLRDWYLTNITLPFPDKPAKERLTTLTGMDFRQLNTWFTNMRRRCGYTEMLRTFADGDKGRFEEMCGEAERGEGPEGLGDALQGMKAYVGKKPRGKVGDWLVNIIEESNREENPRPAKKARTAVKSEDPRLSEPEHTIARPEDPRLSEPEHTIARPQTPTADEPSITPIAPDATDKSTPNESPSTNEAPASEAKRTPTKAKSTRSPPKKQIKKYDFSAGASDETPTKTPSRRRPTAPCRPSPLRTVSDSSTDSLHVVDSGLRSVSGSSTTASNVSGDLNFSFPAFQQTTPPQRPVLVRMPSSDGPQFHHPRDVGQHQQPRITPHYQQPNPHFTFGVPEMNQYLFNPDLPHTVQLPPYAFTSYPAYQQPMLYPPIQLTAPTPSYGYQQFPTFQQPMMRFSGDFGSMKRGYEAVGGTGDERTAKVARFEGM